MTRTATLPDGRQVDTASEDWRAHCEAVTVLGWPLARRQRYLNLVKQRRGDIAWAALRVAVRDLWEARRAAANDSQVAEMARMA